jgi:hypothetical protein
MKPVFEMPKPCPSGKVPYVTERSARQYVRNLAQSTPYKCPHCSQWHLTTQRNLSKRKLRAGEDKYAGRKAHD